MSSVPTTSAGCLLGNHILASSRAQTALVLTGPNTNDLFYHEPGRFLYLTELVAEAHARESRVAVLVSSEGFRQHLPPGEHPASLRLPPADTPPGRGLQQLCADLATGPPTVVVMDYAELRLPSAAVGQSVPPPDQQALLETLATFPVQPALAQHRLVVIDRTSGLDPRLARFPGWRQIRVELPDYGHRLAMVRRILEHHEAEPERFAALEPGLDPDEFARLAGGLTNDELMRASMDCAEAGTDITARWVQQTKVARIMQHSGESLQVLPPGQGLVDVAGLPQVRLFIKERRMVGHWPRSLVLTGPPGVGKSLVVRAIADELRWPAVTLGTFRSMWVGETERNLHRVLSTLRAMEPLVVHVDEADQALGQRGTGPSSDGGTSERVLASLWEFLGASTPGFNVVFVLTTNRPDLLDDATRSRSEIIPILHPSPTERVDLLRIALHNVGLDASREELASALKHADGDVISGRMLVRVAQRAAVLVAQQGGAASDHLATAFDELLERVDPINDERMALASVRLAGFVHYLPWVAAQRLGDSTELLPYIEPLVDDGGRLDLDAVDRRLAELEHQAAARRQARSV